MSSLTTIFVDVTDKRRPFEIHRDARDPQGAAQREIEVTADRYSLARPGRVVRVYVVGQYVKPWRQQSALDVQYEAKDGRATPDYRTVGA